MTYAPPPRSQGPRSDGRAADAQRPSIVGFLRGTFRVLALLVRPITWMFGPSLHPLVRVLTPPLRLLARLLAPIARLLGRWLAPVGRVLARLLSPIWRAVGVGLAAVGRVIARAFTPVVRVLVRTLAPAGRALTALFALIVRVVRRATAWIERIAANRHIRLFVACEFFGVVVAIITGPQGSAAAPTSGFTGALGLPRGLWFYGFGVALFVFRWLWTLTGARMMSAARATKVTVVPGLASIRLRLPLEVLLVAFGFGDVYWIAPHDTWKGGLCIQLGLALLVLELSLVLWHRLSPRLGRLMGYGAVAGYGALAWSHGRIVRELNRIGAVLHNQAFGKFLMIAVLVLAVLELLGFMLRLIRSRLAPRPVRAGIAALGVALLAYGWLMWTHWSQWRTDEHTTLAHWLATHHLLTHSNTGGLAVIDVGAVLLAACALWAVVDLFHGMAGRQESGPARPMLHRVPAVPFRRPAIMIAILLLALEWPLHMDTASQSNLDAQIMPFVLLALGLNVVIGFAGLLDLGYVAFYALGAYATGFFTGALPIHPPFLLDSFWTIPIAIVAAMVAGVLLGLPTLRLRGDYLAIVTLGFGEIIFIFANNLTNVTGGASGAPGFVPGFNFHLVTPYVQAGQTWGPTSYVPTYYLILGVIIVSMLAFSLLERSRVGRSWAAIREDEVAADSIGINALKYKVMAFAIGASTGGLAGVFLVSQSGALYPQDFTIQFSITVVVCVVFGGMGSIPGAVVGALIVEGLPAYLQQHNFSFYDSKDFLLYLGAMLIVMMIFRPQGVIPARRRRREFALAEAGGGFIGGGRLDLSLSQPPVSPEAQ